MAALSTLAARLNHVGRLADAVGRQPHHQAESVVGEYVIDTVLGEGDFGRVYAAENPVIRGRTAIEVLAKRNSSDAWVVSRFVAEATAVNRIDGESARRLCPAGK